MLSVFSAEPKAEADNVYRDLDYSGCQKTNLIIVLLHIVLK